MKKLQIVSLILFTTLITSCIGPKKTDKWIANQYGEASTGNPKMKTDYISITSRLITDDPKTSTTTKQTKNFLPLVFYWQFDYINNCLLNPKIAVNTFSSTVQGYANSKGLKQKLNGQKIELSVNSIPNAFVIKDRAHLIWMVYGISWENISYNPDIKDMVVAYKVTKDNRQTKQGMISIPNTQKIVQKKYLHSIKNATADYLMDYDENIKLMSKKVVDKIIAELAG